MNATTGRLLAVDWGDKRIGLAVSDALGMLASAAGAKHRGPLGDQRQRLAIYFFQMVGHRQAPFMFSSPTTVTLMARLLPGR